MLTESKALDIMFGEQAANQSELVASLRAVVSEQQDRIQELETGVVQSAPVKRLYGTIFNPMNWLR